MTQKIAMEVRPGGPAAKREPSPEGLGLNSEYDVSAVGAALNLGPLAPVSLGADSGFPTTLHQSTATYAAFRKESRTRITDATEPDGKSGGSREPALSEVERGSAVLSIGIRSQWSIHSSGSSP